MKFGHNEMLPIKLRNQNVELLNTRNLPHFYPLIHPRAGSAEVAIPSLLPEKSRLKYESAFTRFERWCEEKHMENIDENTLLTYFEEKSKVQKSSSLWAQYSMLKTVISNKKNIDISNFKNLLQFLKTNAVGYQATKSKVLSRHHIDTFLREADDNNHLLMKVILIIGMAGSCKIGELSYMHVEDVKDEGSYIRISISSVQREFIILDETIDGLNPVEIIRKYVNLRPVQACRFFVAYRNGSAEVPISSQLPEKSRSQYESAFTRFEKWCEEKDMKNLDENTLLTYFEEKAKVRKSSSLWAQYSMLKTVISIKKNIDISNFKHLLLFLKTNAVGYQATKSKVLSRHDIDTFLREADDNTHLLRKVILIIGMAGSCKIGELSYIRVEDVKDEGSYIRISISSVQREFIILDETTDGLNPVGIIRKYVNIRQKIHAGRFFVAYKNGKCINQPVGINTVGALPKKVASFLGLPDPDSYTGYRSRKSAPHSSWPSAHFGKGNDD